MAVKTKSQSIKKFLTSMFNNNRFRSIKIEKTINLPLSIKLSNNLINAEYYLNVAYNTKDKFFITQNVEALCPPNSTISVDKIELFLKKKYNMRIVETKNALKPIIDKIKHEEDLYVIFVEGTSDVHIMQCIFEKFYSDIYCKIKEKIIFQPLGGISQIDNMIKEKNFNKLYKHFMVIADRDFDNPYKSRKHYAKIEKKIKELGGRFIVLKKREIESYIPPRLLVEFYSKKGKKICLRNLTNGKIKRYLNEIGIKLKPTSLAKFLEKYVSYDEFKNHTLYKNESGDDIEEFKYILMIIYKDLLDNSLI